MSPPCPVAIITALRVSFFRVHTRGVVSTGDAFSLRRRSDRMGAGNPVRARRSLGKAARLSRYLPGRLSAGLRGLSESRRWIVRRASRRLVRRDEIVRACRRGVLYPASGFCLGADAAGRRLRGEFLELRALAPVELRFRFRIYLLLHLYRFFRVPFGLLERIVSLIVWVFAPSGVGKWYSELGSYLT